MNAAPPYSWAIIPDAYFRFQLPAGLTFNPSGLLSGTPLEAGDFYPQGRITDALGNSLGFGLVGEVSAGTPKTLDLGSNYTPFLVLNRQSIYDFYLSTPGTAPYTWTITGALPPGVVEQDDPSGSMTFWGVPTVAGSYPVTVRVTDAKGNAAIRIVPLRVTPLYTDSLRLPDGVVGTLNQIQLPVEGGVPPYRWSLGGGAAPPGMTLSTSGILSGVPTAADAFNFTAIVTDAASNTVTLGFTLYIDGLQVVALGALPPVHVGEAFSLQLQTVGGAGGDTWTLQFSNCLVSGLTLTPDGLISGTPTSAGSVRCFVYVTDSQMNQAETLLSFDVIGGTPSRPVVSNGPLSGNVSVGASLSVPIEVERGVEPYSVSAAPGSDLPPGLHFADLIGYYVASLTGYPTKAGRYAFQIQVTDALQAQATTRAYLNVSPLHIIPTPASGLYNQPYSYQFRTLEQQAGLVWTVDPTDSRLPAGLTLGPDGRLSGTPGETGSFPFTVRAGDAVSRNVLEVDSGSSRLLIEPQPALSADIGSPFSYVPCCQPGSATLVSGSLPPGLTLAYDGEITGTPTTAGIYTVTLRVDWYEGFDITVVTIRVGLPQGEIRTLPAATTGKPYAAQLKGGTLAPGDSLPPGLALTADGKLSGTPTAPWLYKFTILLADAPGDTVASTYTIEVLPAVSP